MGVELAIGGFLGQLVAGQIVATFVQTELGARLAGGFGKLAFGALEQRTAKSVRPPDTPPDTPCEKKAGQKFSF